MADPDQSRIIAARAIIEHLSQHLHADLSIQLWNGDVLPLGPNARDDIRFVVRSPDVFRRLLLRPRLMTVFELFAAADIEIVGGDPIAAADRWDHARAVHLARRVDKWTLAKLALPFLFGGKRAAAAAPAFEGQVGAQYQAGRDDKALIQFHYDVSNAFYALFLDPEMVYSSAYFPRADVGLDAAQIAKLDLICRKLRLKPGDRMLDIGCGWGGLACHAARKFGAVVHGVTLSQAQFDFATAKVAALGLQDQVTLELRDYRSIEGEAVYDKVSQVEMFEHVGFDNHDRHFQHVHRLLKPRGVYFHQASVRRVGRDLAKFRKPTATTNVITKFIFPGGELDYIGLTVTNLGRLGFEVHDVEDLREHFEMTLRDWIRRLYARRDEAAAQIGWPRTRLWLIYFALFAKGFERGAVLVYQTVASKRAFGASGMPLSRADLYVDELP